MHANDDLANRLRRAVARLEELHANARGLTEPARLAGKIEGVKLAASYLEEGERIFSPSATAEVA